VAMLCDLDVPVMSVQNSASWGYFNTIKKEWNTEILESAGFPVNILPKTVMGGDPAGKLPATTWHVVPEGTPGLFYQLVSELAVYFHPLIKWYITSLNI